MHTYFLAHRNLFSLCISIQIGERGALYFDDTISSIILYHFEGMKREGMKNVYRLYSILTTFPIENTMDTLAKQFPFHNAIASRIYYLNLDNNFYLFHFISLDLNTVSLSFYRMSFHSIVFVVFLSKLFAFSLFCLLFFLKKFIFVF